MLSEVVKLLLAHKGIVGHLIRGCCVSWQGLYMWLMWAGVVHMWTEVVVHVNRICHAATIIGESKPEAVGHVLRH